MPDDPDDELERLLPLLFQVTSLWARIHALVIKAVQKRRHRGRVVLVKPGDPSDEVTNGGG